MIMVVQRPRAIVPVEKDADVHVGFERLERIVAEDHGEKFIRLHEQLREIPSVKRGDECNFITLTS